MTEQCAICDCVLHRTRGTYAQPTVEGRSHATAHHFVAERFFGRSTNRKGTKTDGVFDDCPWGHEGQSAVFCYECHEELLHNPVLLPKEIERLRELVRRRGFSEHEKSTSRVALAGRIRLFQEIIARGLDATLKESDGQQGVPADETRPAGSSRR